MLLVHIIFTVGLIVGLFALYAPQLEQWNKKHLLGTYKTESLSASVDRQKTQGFEEKKQTKQCITKLTDAGFNHKQATAIVELFEDIERSKSR